MFPNSVVDVRTSHISCQLGSIFKLFDVALCYFSGRVLKKDHRAGCHNVCWFVLSNCVDYDFCRHVALKGKS